LAAQGTNDIDIIVDGPTIRAEVKYFAPPAPAWAGLKKGLELATEHLQRK
jgi:hypothetical protein